jgi:hypothetical protein
MLLTFQTTLPAVDITIATTVLYSRVGYARVGFATVQ